jgi:hypothetical protein
MSIKTTIIRAIYIDGSKYIWKAYKCQSSGYWFLVDPDKYEKCLEKTWVDSVPVINRILENHGMKAKVS